ncbi:hypothetical protein C5F47_00340 [Nitrosopumilus cobalaminigenes]|uniref:LamG-like jellyroll fold domain-containing protein n=1 Tax=Nitrosopumilus cobalaminigenes TaxID=1470066 RepID=A0A7D5R6K3_9ARCH|nr:LamG domain-containing protein [Nitrosopumilus cobalaminigenes]QLH02143.1 hypothetical protein C5F47_00340 [Nitrosopumilus cobalaminigenes]
MTEKNRYCKFLLFFVIIGITFSFPSSFAIETNQEFSLENQNNVLENFENNEIQIQHVLKLQESISVAQNKQNYDKLNSPAEKIGVIKLSENISVDSNDYDYPTIINVKHQSDKQTTKERIYNSEKFKFDSKLIDFLDNSILIPHDNISSNIIEIFSNDKLNLEIQKAHNIFFDDVDLSNIYNNLQDPTLSISEFTGNIQSQTLEIISDVSDPNNPTTFLLLAPLAGVVLIFNEKNNFKLKISRQTQSSALAFLILFSAVSIPLSISDNYWGSQLAFAETNSTNNELLSMQNVTESVDDIISETIQDSFIESTNTTSFQFINMTAPSTTESTTESTEPVSSINIESIPTDSFFIGDYIVIRTNIAENYEPVHTDSASISDSILFFTNGTKSAFDFTKDSLSTFSISDSIVFFTNGTLVEPESVPAEIISIINEPVHTDSASLSDSISLFVTNNLPEADITLLTDETNSNQTSVSLNGNDDYIQFSNSTVTDVVSELTISGWVNPDYSQGSQEFTVISKENQFALSINNIITPEQIAKFSIFDGISWSSVESSEQIGENWTHLAATFNGTQIQIYVNGKLSASQTLPGQVTLVNGSLTTASIETISSDSDILIGGYLYSSKGNGTVSNEFAGQIDNISLYDEQLNEEQISSIYAENHDYYNSMPGDELDLDAILKEIIAIQTNSTQYKQILSDSASISDKIVVISNGTYYSSEPKNISNG